MIIIGVMPDTQCVSGIPSGVIMVVTSLFSCLYALFSLTLLMIHQQPTLVALCKQTHSGGTLSANPPWWYIYQQTHSGCTSSANPSSGILYQQTHSSGTLSANPLLWYTLSANPLRWYSISKPTLVVYLYLLTHSSGSLSVNLPW